MGKMTQPATSDSAGPPRDHVLAPSVAVPATIGLLLFLAACGLLVWSEGRVLALGGGSGGATAWAVRAGAPLLAVLGLAIALKPLELMVGRHALCALVVAAGTRVFAAHLGVAAALLAAALAWLPARPLLAGVLALAGAAAVVALVPRARRRRALPGAIAPETDAKSAGPNEERLRLRQQRQREALLMRAMILAARIDGTLTAHEKSAITAQARKAGLTRRESRILDEEIARPVTIDQLVAACGDDDDLRMRVLAASLFIMRDENDAERAHYASLARALELTPEQLVTVRRKIGR